MKYYISGRMSGLSEEEYRARFRKAEIYLRKQGHSVCNPCRWIWFLKFFPYKVALAFDILMMCRCDRVYMLSEWTLSNGATAEHQFARSVGMVVEYE